MAYMEAARLWLGSPHLGSVEAFNLHLPALTKHLDFYNNFLIVTKINKESIDTIWFALRNVWNIRVI